MDMTGMKIRLITSAGDGDNIAIPEGYSSDFFEDKVILYNKRYKAIFKTKMSDVENAYHGRGIIEIRTSKGTFYKLFFGGNLVSTDEIGLSPRSFYRVIGTKDYSGKIEIIGHPNYSPKAFLGLYWNHPVDYMRISFKLGLISLLLGALSLVETIYSLVMRL